MSAIMFPTHEEVKVIKATYPKGTRIELTEDLDDPQPIAKGEKGTVKDVDDAGMLLMSWDCGRSLGLIPKVDKFRIITE